MRTRAKYFLSLALFVPLLASALPAQGTVYEIDPVNSAYLSGCAGPSLCACPVFSVGPISGGFTLLPLLPQLGPIFEYAVLDFAATVAAGTGGMIVITGTGLYTIDLSNDTQTLLLDALVDGVPATFETVGAIDVAVPFPGQVQVDAYTPIAPPCLYDGMAIVAAPVIGVPFIRGDANEDGSLDISDAVFALSALFPSPIPPSIDCADAADANDDGAFNIADPISILGGLFGGGASPPPPFPACGTDPTADALDCAAHDLCP